MNTLPVWTAGLTIMWKCVQIGASLAVPYLLTAVIFATQEYTKTHGKLEDQSVCKLKNRGFWPVLGIFAIHLNIFCDIDYREALDLAIHIALLWCLIIFGVVEAAMGMILFIGVTTVSFRLIPTPFYENYI